MKMVGKYYLTNKEMLQRKSTYNHQNVLEEIKNNKRQEYVDEMYKNLSEKKNTKRLNMLVKT